MEDSKKIEMQEKRKRGRPPKAKANNNSNVESESGRQVKQRQNAVKKKKEKRKPGRRKGSGAGFYSTEQMPNPRPFDINRVEKMIATALKLDVDSLANRFCADSDDLSLTHFSAMFKEMQFHTIFVGRLSYSELLEFSEHLLLYAAGFIFGFTSKSECPWQEYQAIKMEGCSSSMDSGIGLSLSGYSALRNCNERLFGIYMTYCLYYSQLSLSDYVAKIHITSQQLDHLHKYLDVLLMEEKFEAIYCLYRLFNQGAFSVHAFTEKFNPAVLRTYEFDDAPDGSVGRMTKVEATEELDSFGSLGSCQLLQQVGRLHIIYEKMKANNSRFVHLNSAETNPVEVFEKINQELANEQVKL